MNDIISRLKDSQKSPEKLALLVEASHILNSTLEYEELMKNVLHLVVQAVNAEAAIVYRYDPSHQDLRVRFYSGDEPHQITIHMGQGFVGWVAEHQEPILTNTPAQDERFSEEIQNVELKSIICYPLFLRGKFFGVVEAINKKDGHFEQTDLDTLNLLADQIALAINNAQLYRSVKRESLRRKTLFEVSRQLLMPFTLDELLNNILVTLKRVIDYNAGSVFLINDETGHIDSITSIGYDPVLEIDLKLKIGQGLVGWVARTGEAVIVPDTSKDDRYINARPETKSELVAPIRSDRKLIGVLNLESDRLNAFSEDDKEILNTFSPQAAISIERARMHRLMLDQKKIEEQLLIARDIQKTFLPDKVPQVVGYDIWGANIPSGEVGGDYYDFIQIVDNQL
jgi:GAF domain-containing protein